MSRMLTMRYYQEQLSSLPGWGRYASADEFWVLVDACMGEMSGWTRPPPGKGDLGSLMLLIFSWCIARYLFTLHCIFIQPLLACLAVAIC